MSFKEGDLVLRVGLTEFGDGLEDDEKIALCGVWTAGKIYSINDRGNVPDNNGSAFTGPNTRSSDRFNEFVSFDELYDEALSDDVFYTKVAARQAFDRSNSALYNVPNQTGAVLQLATAEGALLRSLLPSSDPVIRPSHWTRNLIEPAAFIAANKLSFNRGSAVKYITRAGFKDPAKEIEDLEKARRFLEMEIEVVRRNQRVAAGEDAKDVWKVAL